MPTPAADKIVLLVNAGNPNARADEPEIQAAAAGLGQRLEVLTASTDDGGRQDCDLVECACEQSYGFDERRTLDRPLCCLAPPFDRRFK